MQYIIIREEALFRLIEINNRVYKGNLVILFHISLDYRWMAEMCLSSASL